MKMRQSPILLLTEVLAGCLSLIDQNFFQLLHLYVLILATAWHIVEAVEDCQDGDNWSCMFLSMCIALSLLVAPSGLENFLECQGKVSLHYAAIYELSTAIDGRSPQKYGF